MEEYGQARPENFPNINDYRNSVVARHSSSKLGSALAAPESFTSYTFQSYEPGASCV